MIFDFEEMELSCDYCGNKNIFFRESHIFLCKSCNDKEKKGLNIDPA